jgi:hypothetical protein
MKILTIIPTFNRKKITELSLTNIVKYKKDSSVIVYDDYSTEYDITFLLKHVDGVFREPTKMGVQYLRAKQFRDFVNKYTDYDYLYITDNDAIHDPTYIDVLKECYTKWKLPDGRKLPVSLYNTVFHNHQGNTIKEQGDVLLRKTAPGISQFYDRDMVNIMVNAMNMYPKLEGQYGFDYHLPATLCRPFITTKTSYLEHYGSEGIHSVKGIEGMNRDRALNPTDYLKHNRDSIIDYVLFDGKKIEDIIL